MSYILNTKIIKDTDDEFQDYAYGLTLPLSRGNTGYFAQGFTTIEQAKSNLLNLLLTRKGERVMQPNFGTGLHSILFEQVTDDLSTEIEETITNNVNYWLPYINIENINVNMTNEMIDRNMVELSISFTIGNQIDLQEITFNIQG